MFKKIMGVFESSSAFLKRPFPLDPNSVIQDSKRIALQNHEGIPANLSMRDVAQLKFAGQAYYDFSSTVFNLPASETPPPIETPNLVWDPRFPSKNPHFVGREDLLIQLTTYLGSNQIGVINQVASVGLGGIGKTELAKEFVHQNKNNYGLVWWMRAESLDTLLEDYQRLAKTLGVPDPEGTRTHEWVDAVKMRLHERGFFLLVFDNAEDPKQIKEFLPTNGHILITSRNQDWITTIGVPPFGIKDMADYFEKVFGQDHPYPKADIALLGETLGYLPLAVVHAVGYLREEKTAGVTINDYLSLFNSLKSEILNREERVLTDKECVFITWDATTKKIVQHNPQAVELITMCAFFSPEDIPKAVLLEWIKHKQKIPLSDVQAQWALSAALRELKRYSMITVTHDTVSVHRLVQSVTQSKLSFQQQKLVVEQALEVLFKLWSFKEAITETWRASEPLLSHIKAIWEIVQSNDALLLEKKGLSQLWEMCNGIGSYYCQVKVDYSYAVQLAQTLIQTFNGLADPLFDGEKALAYVQLASAYGFRDGNHCETSVNAINEAKKFLEGGAEMKPLYKANILQAVAKSYKYRLMYDDAEAHYTQAIGIYNEVNTLEANVKAAMARNDLALVYARRAEQKSVVNWRECLDQAEALLNQSLRFLNRETFPHPNVNRGMVMANLGFVEKVKGDNLGDASHHHTMKTFYENSLAEYEAIYSDNPDHPKLAMPLSSLAYAYEKIGDFSKALELYSRSLKLIESSVSKNEMWRIGMLKQIDSCKQKLTAQCPA
jgi:tetratricopeptide (TPR) repeat protein